MIIRTSKKERNKKRHLRIRKYLYGTSKVPRLSFFKSNKHIYAQVVDDEQARTLLFCSTLQEQIKNKLKSTWTKDAAKTLGEFVAKDALSKGIKKVVFDRGGSKYHGKVLAFATAARSCGLEF